MATEKPTEPSTRATLRPVVHRPTHGISVVVVELVMEFPVTTLGEIISFQADAISLGKGGKIS